MVYRHLSSQDALNRRGGIARVQRVTAIVMLVLLLATPALAGATAPFAANVPNALAGPEELVIAFDPSTSEADRDALVAARGGTTIQRFDSIDARLVRFEPSMRRGSNADRFDDASAVRYAEPNARFYLTVAPPDDTLFDSLWGLHNTGQAGGTAGADIDALTAWDTTTGSSDIVVGVVDAAVAYNHPDLDDNMWTAPQGWTVGGCGAGTHGYQSIDGVTGCDPSSPRHHGTHVAGTIGAEGNNAIGVTGVNWRTSIMTLSAFGEDGSSTVSDVVAVLDYAIQAKQAGVNLRVINTSFGCYESTCNSQAMFEQFRILYHEGVLVVASAGNVRNDNDATPQYPSGFDLPNIISVAATTNQDALATFSNYGRNSVDIAAPGVDIVSTLCYPVGENCLEEYTDLSGTSMAAPHVSGAAALILSAPGLGDMNVIELRDRLLYCGDAIPALADVIVSGRRLNVASSMAGCDLPTYTVTLQPTTNGTISAAPVADSYQPGTIVTVTATPDAGYALKGWTVDGAPAGSANPLSFMIHSNTVVAAEFEWVGLSTTLTVDPVTATYAGTTALTATLSSQSGPVAGVPVAFSINGSAVCGVGSLPACPVTNGAGVARLEPVSLMGIDAGVYPGGIQASFAGDGTDLASSGVADLTVTQVTLTFTAEDKHRRTGEPNPPLTYTVTGFVAGEDAAVLSGAPLLSTTATTNSRAGQYPIRIEQGTLSASNYTFQFVPGTLTVDAGTLARLNELNSLIVSLRLGTQQTRTMQLIVVLAIYSESGGRTEAVCWSMTFLETYVLHEQSGRRLTSQATQLILAKIGEVRLSAGCGGLNR